MIRGMHFKIGLMKAEETGCNNHYNISMFMKKSIYIFLVFLILLACQNEKSEVQILLKEPVFVDVKYENLRINGLPDFFYGHTHCIFENYLLLFQETPFERYYLIDLDAQTLIGAFGEEDGPNKVNHPYCNCQLIKEGKAHFTILNDGGEDHVMFQINDGEKTSRFFRKKITSKNINILPTSTVYLSEDRKHLFGFNSEKTSVFNLDLNTNNVDLVPTGPDLKINTDRITRSNIFFARTALSRDGKLFGIAYCYFNLIEIYDSKFNLLQAISIGKPSKEIPKIYEGGADEDSKYYTGFIVWGKNNIYLPYHFRDIKTINSSRESMKIVIINLKNHEIKGINIPIAISKFTVDEKENYLYATTEDDSNKDGNLIRINLRGLNEKE